MGLLARVSVQADRQTAEQKFGGHFVYILKGGDVYRKSIGVKRQLLFSEMQNNPACVIINRYTPHGSEDYLKGRRRVHPEDSWHFTRIQQ
jgi:hypothetical protein